jgi:hypothetical protein
MIASDSMVTASGKASLNRRGGAGGEGGQFAESGSGRCLDDDRNRNRRRRFSTRSLGGEIAGSGGAGRAGGLLGGERGRAAVAGNEGMVMKGELDREEGAEKQER